MFNWVNPIRAGIVKRPEHYRWCSLGYHQQSGNAGELLSLEFGLADWDELDPREVVRKYREFIYETGAADSRQRSVVSSSQLEETERNRGIDQRILERERRCKYRVGQAKRFLHRSRYFTDSGIIGSPVKSCLRQGAYGSFHRASKEFVGEVFDKVKHLLSSKDERRFTPIGGVEGVYSMKRLG